MRLCPSCGKEYPDDANFCPMDATRLPTPKKVEASAAAPETIIDLPKLKTIGGRFLVLGVPSMTPSGKTVQVKDMTTQIEMPLKWADAALSATAQLAERTLRELKQMTKVSSDKVVKVLDAGRDEEGNLYVVNEPPRGTTLEAAIATRGPLPWNEVKQIASDIGSALIEGQKVGVIHRDLCPRNVWLDAGTARLGDFGLAEPVTESVFGNPAFISPEQAEGKGVDPRSSVYSLAATLYYAATGETLFAGDAAAQLQQQVSATPPTLRARRPDAPEGGIL